MCKTLTWHINFDYFNSVLLLQIEQSLSVAELCLQVNVHLCFKEDIFIVVMYCCILLMWLDLYKRVTATWKGNYNELFIYTVNVHVYETKWFV